VTAYSVAKQWVPESLPRKVNQKVGVIRSEWCKEIARIFRGDAAFPKRKGKIENNKEVFMETPTTAKGGVGVLFASMILYGVFFLFWFVYDLFVQPFGWKQRAKQMQKEDSKNTPAAEGFRA
jgi:hypothetical protein